jgi:hypothetical protein
VAVSNKSASEVEVRLQDHAKALSDLQTLVQHGCNRAELISALEIAFLAADESWKELVGMNLRAFKTALTQIRSCADMIDRLNRSDLIYRLSIEYLDPLFVGLHEAPTLPERLRDYAGLLDHRRKLFGPRRNIRRHVWKAWIVAIVTEDSPSPHDPEVASIIAAILDDSKYSEKAHQAWRLKHQDFIEVMRTKLKAQRFKRGFPPAAGPLRSSATDSH